MSNTPRVKITSAENPRCSAFDFLAQAKSAPSWGTHWWLHDGYVWKDGSCQTCVPHVQHGHEKVIQKHTTVLFWIVQPYSKPTQVDSYILRRRLREFISRNSAKLSRTFGRRDTSLCVFIHTWSRNCYRPLLRSTIRGYIKLGAGSVYQKHRTLQNRKMLYNVWNLPSAPNERLSVFCAFIKVE